MSVSAMLATDQTRGLFRAAIGQSASAFGRAMAGATVADAEAQGLKLQAALGCRNLAEMRACAPQQILDATDESGLWFRPIIDGAVIPEDYITRFAAGRQNRVPVIMGCTADEDCLHETQPDDYANYLESAKEFGARAEEYRKVFPAENDEQAGRVVSFARTARTFAGMRMTAEYQMAQGCDAYLYSFVQTLPNADGTVVGPFHSAELVYQFGTLYTGWRPWREEDYRASERMMDYWANFVKTGDPNGEGLPRWEKHAAGDKQCLLLGADPHMGAVPRAQQADFMEACIREGIL